MKYVLPFCLFLFCSSLTFNKTQESVKLFLNGKEVKDKISLKATGKLEIVLPTGWRYISGKVRILQGDEAKKVLQVTGENALKEFDLLQFIKLNALSGNYLSLELSVRTKESGTLSTMKIPIE
jgi:hypothetical protein